MLLVESPDGEFLKNCNIFGGFHQRGTGHTVVNCFKDFLCCFIDLSIKNIVVENTDSFQYMQHSPTSTMLLQMTLNFVTLPFTILCNSGLAGSPLESQIMCWGQWHYNPHQAFHGFAKSKGRKNIVPLQACSELYACTCSVHAHYMTTSKAFRSLNDLRGSNLDAAGGTGSASEPFGMLWHGSLLLFSGGQQCWQTYMKPFFAFVSQCKVYSFDWQGELNFLSCSLNCVTFFHRSRCSQLPALIDQQYQQYQGKGNQFHSQGKGVI